MAHIRKPTALIAMMLSLSAAPVSAEGQGLAQSDPYAQSLQSAADRKYRELKADFLEAVRTISFAGHCQVIQAGAIDLAVSRYMLHSGLTSNEMMMAQTRDLVPGTKYNGGFSSGMLAGVNRAKTDGEADAKQGCQFFQEHPDMVQTIRQLLM
jgi:hypothetical protein